MRTIAATAYSLCAVAATLVPLDSVTAGSCNELRTHDGVGFPVASLGDLDRDGVTDYALSNVNAMGGGIVYVHSGKSGALIFEVTGDGTPSLNGELFGFAIAKIGDVGSASGGPKDGVADVLIGAPRMTRNNASLGYVRVVSGADGGEIRRVLGIQSAELFGYSIASPGDVDADGWDDFAVGAPGVGGGRAGSVRFFSGRDGSAFPGRVTTGTDPGGNLGRSLAAVGDVDNDGVPDVAASAPNAFDTQGEVVILSSAGGPPIDSTVGKKEGDRIGALLQSLPDFDRDGVDDLLVSSLEGTTFGFSPGRKKLLFKLGPGALVQLGDLDRDGIVDIGLYAGAIDGNGRLEGHLSSKLLAARPSKSPAFVCPGDPPGFGLLVPAVGIGDVDSDGRSEILMGGAGTARVVSVDATPSNLKLTVRAPLQRTPEMQDERAFGTVALEVKKDLQRLRLKLKKLPLGSSTALTVQLEDAPQAGTYQQVAQVTASSKGAVSLKLEGVGAPPSELGVSSYADLEGRRLEIRDASGAAVLAVVFPSFAPRANDKAKGALTAPPGSPTPSASAKVKASFKGTTGASLLDVKLKKADKKATYTVWMEDAVSSGNLVEVGATTKARFQRKSARGDPLPFGTASALDLSGRKIEIRDAADAVVVSGTIP